MYKFSKTSQNVSISIQKIPMSFLASLSWPKCAFKRGVQLLVSLTENFPLKLLCPHGFLTINNLVPSYSSTSRIAYACPETRPKESAGSIKLHRPSTTGNQTVSALVSRMSMDTTPKLLPIDRILWDQRFLGATYIWPPSQNVEVSRRITSREIISTMGL